MNKLSHGIINADELKLEVERSIVIEHLKETNTSWHNSHSFGINFGAMLNFANIHSVTSGIMATPVVRNEKGYSIEETISKSGIYAKEKTVKIGNVIKITPTLRNEGKISVFDTAPISSIGSMMSGVQEIKENLTAIREHHHNDIIIDAEPVEVIQEYKEKTVIAVDAEPKTPEKQEDFSIRQDEIHEVIDEIYYEDIAPYHEFEDIQRASSPDRVETELTKAVGKVQDVANGLANASDFSNMPDPIIGADSDPQSMVALGKGVMKVVEFAGCIFEPIIGAAANSIGTKVRRALRDDWNVSQAKAQDIGDITHVIAGLLVPGCTAKVISKAGKLTSFGKVTKQFTKLDWSTYRESHVNRHIMPDLSKSEHGVFYGNPIAVTNEAWIIAQEKNIQPIQIGGRDHYVIPRNNSGYSSGYAGNGENLNYILLITEHKSNKIVTAFPSHNVSGNIKQELMKKFYNGWK